MTTPETPVNAAQLVVDGCVSLVAQLTAEGKRLQIHPAKHPELIEARRRLADAQEVLAQRQKGAEQARFGDRIAVAEEDIRIMRHALASAALRAEEQPANGDLQATVAQSRADLAASEQRLENLHLARAELDKRNVQQQREAECAHLVGLHAQHKAAEQKALKLAADLVDYLAAAGPKWVATHQAVRDAISLHHTALRLAGGSKAVQRHGNATSAIENPLVQGIVCALAATRIAQTGPSLSPWVHIGTPLGQQTGASQMVQQMKAQFERQRDTVANYAPEYAEANAKG